LHDSSFFLVQYRSEQRVIETMGNNDLPEKRKQGYAIDVREETDTRMKYLGGKSLLFDMPGCIHLYPFGH